MADKKSGGFKSFLLIVIVLVLGVFLGLGAFLMLSPESSVFGLCYVANTKEVVIEHADNAESTDLFNFNQYSTVNVVVGGGTGYTSVHVNCGVKGMSNSKIILDQSSYGFAHVGGKKDYTVSAISDGSILNITVTEPSYDFIQVTKNTVLNINIYNRNNVGGVTFNIQTGGAVVLGGKVATVDAADYPLKIQSANITTTTGKIYVANSTEIGSELICKTEKGAITINGDKTIPTLKLSSTTGKITTNKITGDVNIETYNSNVSLGDVDGSVHIDMESGLLNLQNVTGDLVSGNKLLYTAVYAKTITGDVTLVHDKANFSVNIDKIEGNVDITAGNKNINIGEFYGVCDITTTNGSIIVTKASDNTNQMRLTSSGSGAVSATFGNLQGSNIITTNKGTIKIYFGSESVFVVNAETDSNIYKDWLKTYYQKTLEGDDKYVGGTSSANTLDLKSTSGPIRLYKVFTANEE